MKKRVVAGLLLCVMMLSGCGSTAAIKRDETAVSFAKTKYDPVSLGEYTAFTRFLQSVQYTQYQDMYRQYLKQSGEDSDGKVMDSVWDVAVNNDSSSDSSASASADSSEKKTSSEDDIKAVKESTEGDVLKNLSADYLTEFALAARHADDYKLKLSDSEKKLIDKAASNYYKANEKGIAYDGYTEDDVKAFLTDYTLFAKVSYAVRQAADVSVTDEESKVADISYIYVSYGKDDSNLSENKAKEIAGKILADVQNGADMTSEADLYNQTTASSTTMAPLDKTQSYVFSDEDLKKIYNAESGSVISDVLKGDDNRFYVVKVTKNGDKTEWDDYKAQLLENKKMQAYNDLYEKWSKEAGIKYDEDALNSVKITDKVIFKEKEEKSSGKDTSSTTSSPEASSSSDSSENVDK